MEEGPSEDPYTEHVKDTSTLCGKTPSDWAKIFYPLLQAALNSTDSDLKRYPPALSYKDANRMYKEMGATFPFEDPEQPTANMAYHWMRLYEVKTRVYELGQKRMHVDKIKDKRVRKRTRKLMKKVRTT
ncbi:hypothetical protein SARC_05822 [Sphaeroforma arctica JP610]|uniref:Uncharacterized protein n=1 Tax=Sphaeroforma arctica JP610 TaxID=667725 RepID=A0A0L0FZ80_9EUKA|nr:hypothetical protein SARC_05822 [Sphaeroforma arctica JP610]KNC81876.1 hypothetical protein SARC_05822 [Sphaeroforma arctica JP610]|eukprot:XP_014155778.1 hypothetical protein SARC_05822 [Sphaeroforma arctica JP610]